MTGRLVKNLRSGHTAEDLGVLFLRNFCAVAQIRKEDDIGIDAVATLLREQGKFLYAENSFFIQVKSKSVSHVLYQNEDIDWLINQDLPFFICTVDKEEEVIEIYTTNPAYLIIGFRSYNKLRLNFTQEPHGFMERIEFDEDIASVDIGPPIIVSSLNESKKSEKARMLYNIMKVWVDEEHKQTQLRKLGFSIIARWETGFMPDYYGKIVKGHTANIVRDLRAAKPYLEYLSNHVEWNNSTEEYKKETLRGLKKWYKEYDLDISLNVDKKILHKDDNQEIYTD